MSIATRIPSDLSRSLLPLPYIESHKLGLGSDFSIYTGSMRPINHDELPEGDTDRPIIRMRGSSTVQDLQGDIMALSALEDMTKVNPDLLLWLNHSYELPQDLFAKLYQLPTIQMQGGVADLWLMAEAVLSNSPAEKTYNYIVKEKVRLGCSVGCQVLEWDLLQPDDPYSPIVIKRVYVVEWSVVSIPANQRCWVENAIKGRFARSLIEGDGETAIRLAPAFKSLYDSIFASMVENLKSDGLAKDLRRVKSHNRDTRRIAFDIGNDIFYLETKGMKKSLTREETSALFTHPGNQQVETTTDNVDGDELDTTKAVSGKTSLPLMDIKTEWTGSKAEKQIFDWARDEQDKIVASKAKQCFLYCNPDESDKQGGYKMPYCFIVDGSPKIVPLGVRACAGVLSGGMGGVEASTEDKDGMKSKVKTMYGRINSEFHPDPEWEVPWEKGEKSVEPDVQKEIADSESDAPLNRQDVGEVTVSKDGSHEPFTGEHSHPHSAFNSQGDDSQHSHLHRHNGDASHDHSHEGKNASSDDIVHGHVEVLSSSEQSPHDYEQAALLNVYNSIGKQLGLPDVLTTKCDLVPTDSDASVVRTMLSSLDDVSDALIGMAQRNDYYVDALMQLMGVPDTNDVGTEDDDDSNETTATLMPMRYSLQPLTTKEGREISGANRNHLQVIHDTVCAMHPDACASMSGMPSDGTSHQDGNVTVEEAQEQARQMGQGDSYSNLSSLMANTTKSVLMKAFEGLEAKSLVEGVVQKSVDAAISDARASLELLQREQLVLMQHIGKLTNMPLGRPTNLQRSVAPASFHALDNVASYEEMLQTAGIEAPKQHSLSELAGLTQVVSKSLHTVNGEITTKMRYWPAGIGKGYRPVLTAGQKVLMHSSDWERYREASDDVFVPVVDDPFMEG